MEAGEHVVLLSFESVVDRICTHEELSFVCVV